MGKYASGLSIQEVCGYEVEEATQVLHKHDVPKEDVEIITGMIQEAYYQLGQAYDYGKELEEFLSESLGEDEFKRLMELFVRMRTNKFLKNSGIGEEVGYLTFKFVFSPGEGEDL